MTTACARAPRDEENRGKNNKLILTAKTRKKRQRKLRMDMRNVYISL